MTRQWKPGDPKLYSLEEGITPCQISKEVHKETVQRYKEWSTVKEKAEKLRERIEDLQADLLSRNGALAQDWSDVLDSVARKYDQIDTVELTFLHRVYKELIDLPGRECTHLSLEFIKRFLPWTHGNFSKTAVSRHVQNYTMSTYRITVEELRRLVDFIDRHSSHSLAEQQHPACKILIAFECIWGLPTPSLKLRIPCRNLGECIKKFRM